MPFPLPRDALFLVVILVVFLSVVPLGRGEQLCGHSGAGTLELVDLLLGDVALRVVEVEQRAHILRLRLILIRMQREKLVDELRVGDGRRIEDDLDRFAVAGLAGADLAVRWRVCVATGVADTRRAYAPEPLECGLRGPESAEREVCDLGVAASGINSVLGAHLRWLAIFRAHQKE